MATSNWKYFTLKEFMCKCGCGRNEIKTDFINKLDAIREFHGSPITVTSGYRCPEYNASISSTGLTGPHTTGRAVDIAVDGKKAFYLLPLIVMSDYYTGIGFDIKKGFIHLDDLHKEPRPNIWTY